MLHLTAGHRPPARRPATGTQRPAAGRGRPAAVLLTVLAVFAGSVAAGNLATAATTPVVSLWAANAVPANSTSADARSVEVATRFTSDATGWVTGVRFYKGDGNTGTHVGTLWTNTGTMLAQATFTDETGSGWQSVTFSKAVAIGSDTIYVVSYHAPNGHVAADSGYFASTRTTNRPLHAWVDGTWGYHNGAYLYGSQPAFPTASVGSTNYWVDVLFQTSMPTTTTAPRTSTTTTPSTSTSSTPSSVPTSTTSTSTTTTRPTTTTTSPSTTTTSSTTTTTAPPSSGSLAVNVSGNHFVDGAGNTVRLRGVNASGTEYVCAQGWSDNAFGSAPFGQLSSFQAMTAWHANVVRIPLNEDCWLGINGVRIGGASYQNQIATEVALAHQAGLYVILELHWSAPGSVVALSQQPAPDLDHSPTFWSQVAAAYKNDHATIFDLYNEPVDQWGTNSDQWAGWLNGDTQTGYWTADFGSAAATWQTAGMQLLLTTVRNTGATNPVIVNGEFWSNDVTGWLSHAPVDPAGQLVVGSHMYPGQPGSTSSNWDTVYPALAASYPIVIGEIGDSVTTATFLPTFLPYAESHGWNYLAWTWNVWPNAANVLITNYDGTPNAGEGTTYRNWLLAH